ncbi:MAG: hypothetical protein K0Q83_1021 [Deltaproteobacteria bacterium]|nr:hypothetical protein [Deltaproteobacteria bacterium]
MPQHPFNPAWFVRKDLDGFFGLMIDNLIQLILIVSLCRELIHLPDEYIFGKILPHIGWQLILCLAGAPACPPNGS